MAAVMIIFRMHNNNSLDRRIGEIGIETPQLLESDQRKFELNVTMSIYFRIYALEVVGHLRTIYLVYIRALISLYQIITKKCTHIFFNHNFINIIRHSSLLQQLKGHLQRTQLIHSSSSVNKLCHQT